jgi:bacteriocin-like protein
MKKFVELNEKELMNVEGGATVEGGAFAYAGCKSSTADMGYYANGSLAAGADGVNGAVSMKGFSAAGSSFSVFAVDQTKPYCRKHR